MKGDQKARLIHNRAINITQSYHATQILKNSIWYLSLHIPFNTAYLSCVFQLLLIFRCSLISPHIKHHFIFFFLPFSQFCFRCSMSVPSNTLPTYMTNQISFTLLTRCIVAVRLSWRFTCVLDLDS